MATRTRKPAAKKVIVLSRIAWKHEDRVVYFSKSSKLKDSAYILLPHGIVEIDGRQYKSIVRDGERYAIYQTVFVDGQCVGCSCGSRNGTCRHRTQLSAIEAQRREQTQERHTDPVMPVVIPQLPRADFFAREMPREHRSDPLEYGNLNGSRAFGLMR